MGAMRLRDIEGECGLPLDNDHRDVVLRAPEVAHPRHVDDGDLPLRDPLASPIERMNSLIIGSHHDKFVQDVSGM